MPIRYEGHKLLIANRGEIAVRIIRTAHRIGLQTLAIFTPSDSLSAHVSLAKSSVELPLTEKEDESQALTESEAYLSITNMINICKTHNVTCVHPGYGFLAENSSFASAVLEAGLIWLGPRPELIRFLGLKHEAKEVARSAGLDVIPGTLGLVQDINEALRVAANVGFPVILKPTAGGGGLGMLVCSDEGDLKRDFEEILARTATLFGQGGVVLEKYFQRARHIEIQVFGNGLGDVIHMGERECSVQRRYQKITEETPSPFFFNRGGLKSSALSLEDLRDRMCAAAVKLCNYIKYSSAGTIEFIVDEATNNFYFLELNTRIQVEHAITEAIFPGLDLIELMIKQGFSERESKGLSSNSEEMQQAAYDNLRKHGIDNGHNHSIECRIYAEDPSENYLPCPGLLQHVQFCQGELDWLRVETWVETGVNISQFFDPLLAKIIVTGSSRDQALHRLRGILNTCRIEGPPNNIELLARILDDGVFCAGKATTRFLDGFSYIPRAFKVISSGLDISVQDLPGRSVGYGIPRSGPMDPLAFSLANLLVGNPELTEGLEIIVIPGFTFSLLFHVSATISVTGKTTHVHIGDERVAMWTRLTVPAKGTLKIEVREGDAGSSGLRVYLAIKGGFPRIPRYLGSKSTSMGLGGYQGRSLLPGDQIALGDCEPVIDLDNQRGILTLSSTIIPRYTTDWIVYVLSGPHDDVEFVTKEGVDRFYATKWHVSSASNRLGIRLESPENIEWARMTGGEGGSHPSNILDNGYAPGTININGDTPVILTNEGPDMGGYVCLCTVATADMWKLGQLSPGCTVQFRRVPWSRALRMKKQYDGLISAIAHALDNGDMAPLKTVNNPLLFNDVVWRERSSPILFVRYTYSNEGNERTRVVYRQAGDSAILVEFGLMSLSLFTRGRIHAFQTLLLQKKMPGMGALCPCIRSILCFYDPQAIPQQTFLQNLISAELSLNQNVEDMQFVGRRIHFPIVLDDPWNKEALERYMLTTRDKAVYLPSNVEYLARNNGLQDGNEALQKLVECDWLVFGVGFYLACPFLVPIDPRCRLIGQKMNPSRTFTPRGAVGIAGPVAAIYPIESPGGYQLFGRTLSTWQTWGKGKDFDPDKPWLLQAFDQVRFFPVSECEYLKIEKDFDAGKYAFEIEEATFSMAEHAEFLKTISHDLAKFRKAQAKGSALEQEREIELLQSWEQARQAKGHKVQLEAEFYSETENLTSIASSVYGLIWKIKCKIGDVVLSEGQVMLLLEAMKTEIPVKAGPEHVGKIVKGFGKNVEEQKSIRPGDLLLVLY